MMANRADTKMIAGNTWKANTTPNCECCAPMSPKTNDDPA